MALEIYLLNIFVIAENALDMLEVKSTSCVALVVKSFVWCVFIINIKAHFTIFLITASTYSFSLLRSVKTSGRCAIFLVQLINYAIIID